MAGALIVTQLNIITNIIAIYMITYIYFILLFAVMDLARDICRFLYGETGGLHSTTKLQKLSSM
jgi:hypothetical protein